MLMQEKIGKYILIIKIIPTIFNFVYNKQQQIAQ